MGLALILIIFIGTKKKMLLVLSLVPILKQQFNELINGGSIKEANIKNRTYYFFGDMISIEDFDSNLMKMGKNCTKTLVFITLGTSQ